MLSGTVDERYFSVHRCRNEMSARHLSDPETYPRDGSQAFWMNEVDYLQAQKEAEGEGEQVTAVYHSHVGAGAYFSAMDQEFANSPFFPFPGVSHIVLAVWERNVSGAGVFECDPASGLFIGARIEVGEE